MASWSARVPVAAARSSPPVVPRVVIVLPSEAQASTDAHPPGCGFRPAHRLHKTDEFSSVFAFRRSFRGRYFNLHYCPNKAGSARLGVVVAKKLARQAVLRNLVKRIARDVFRLSRCNLPHHDLVIRLAAPVADVPRAALREDIEALLKRLPR